MSHIPKYDHQAATSQVTIAGLDEALGENIHPSQNVLLLGPPPSGRFTLAIQFLASGLRARECALLVTTGDTPSAIKKRVRATGWNLERYEKQGELMYVTCHRTDGTAAAPRPAQKEKT